MHTDIPTPSTYLTDITFRAQRTALSIVPKRDTRGKKRSKFKGKYHLNNNVNMTCPFKSHTENRWKQKQYGELGSEITKNWELLAVS